VNGLILSTFMESLPLRWSK